MKALVQHGYGAPAAALRLDDVPLPEPNDAMVRVRVRHAAVNPLDWKVLDGQYKWLVKARPPCGVGFDVAGEVDACGPRAKRLARGTRVAGMIPVNSPVLGAMAQFALVPELRLAVLPDGVTTEQAAGLPVVGLSALQMCREVKLQRGQRVLVHGGAGGIGHVAVQLALELGVRVTATTRAATKSFVAALGAEQVIDYGAGSVAAWGGPYDAVLDCGATLTEAQVHGLLPEGGRFIRTLPRFPRMLFDPVLNLARRRKHYALMLKAELHDLDYLLQLMADGRLRVEVSGVFTLDRAVEALTVARAGSVRGKLLVAID